MFLFFVLRYFPYINALPTSCGITTTANDLGHHVTYPFTEPKVEVTSATRSAYIMPRIAA